MSEIWILISIPILFVLDLVAVATRAAYQNTSQARLLSLREEREKITNRALLLYANLTRLRASLNLTLVFSRFLLAGLVLYGMVVTFHVTLGWVVFPVLVLCALLLYWLEWAVERGAMLNPEITAGRLAPFGKIVIWVMFFGTGVPPFLAGEPKNSSDVTSSVTENDLKTLVDAGEEEGVFEQEERRMIYSIFSLGERLAREIMIPRIDMLAIEVTTPLNQAIEIIHQSGHSRVPVFDETVDQTLGVVYVKDLLRVFRGGIETSSLRDLLRPAYFIPEAKHLDSLLAEMQSQRIHIAIVVDEYGGVAGLVTLEDIVEEIVGEIQDEYDQGEESPYQALENGDFIFQGRIDLDDFNDRMGSHLLKEEADTIGGYIYSHLGRIPVVGDEVKTDDLLLTVEQVTARRIRKVRGRWIKEDPQQIREGEDETNDPDR